MEARMILLTLTDASPETLVEAMRSFSSLVSGRDVAPAALPAPAAPLAAIEQHDADPAEEKADDDTVITTVAEEAADQPVDKPAPRTPRKKGKGRKPLAPPEFRNGKDALRNAAAELLAGVGSPMTLSDVAQSIGANPKAANMLFRGDPRFTRTADKKLWLADAPTKSQPAAALRRPAASAPAAPPAPKRRGRPPKDRVNFTSPPRTPVGNRTKKDFEQSTITRVRDEIRVELSFRGRQSLVGLAKKLKYAPDLLAAALDHDEFQDDGGLYSLAE